MFTIAALLATVTGAPAFGGGFDVFTDFEFTDTDGFFELGTSPNSVQFIDGDCELDGGWIPTARAALAADPELGVVCGRRRDLRPSADC